MTLRNLSDKEIKTINGGIDCCGYECGFPFKITSCILCTLENIQNIFQRIANLNIVILTKSTGS